MNYIRIYEQLIKSRLQENEYTERHHIIPKCMGGGDVESNIATLSARKHLIAHKLLCKIYPENAKLKIALFFMLSCNRYGRARNSKEYATVRGKVSLQRKQSATPINSLTFDFIAKVDRKISNRVRHLFSNLTDKARLKTIKAVGIYIQNLVNAKLSNKVLSVSRNQSKNNTTKISHTFFKKAESYLFENGYIDTITSDSNSAVSNRVTSSVVPSDKIIEDYYN